MSDDAHSNPPLAPRKATRLSGLSALHGELADPLPTLEIPSEPPASAPPPMADFGSEPPPAPGTEPPAEVDDEHAIMRGEDFGKWAEPEAPKRSIDTMVGKIVDGRYEIRGMIGRGGMGAVFEAWQPSVQRTVALKVLLREFAENETVIKRFHKEALAASRLTHPNTISVYDFGQTDDGVLFIAMEYLRGVDLGSVLGAGPMPVDRALGIMRQVCKSLSEAHKAGIIHRDLKPDNVFLTEVEGEVDFVKVLDFGVAKLREGDGHERTLTQAGTMFGTPKYMSPEQTRSTQLDARSDIYSLGVILYEMLLGEPPFVSDNPLSILIAHVNEEPAPFVDRQPDLDLHPAVEAVVFQALSKSREARQPDVDTLLDQVEALIALRAGTPFAELADRLPAVSAGYAPPPPIDMPDIGSVVLDEAPDHRRRKAPVVPIVLAAVVVTGALYAAFGVGDDRPQPLPPPPDRAPTLAAAPTPDPPQAPDAAAPEAPVEREFVVTTDPLGVALVRAEDEVEVGASSDAPGGAVVRLSVDAATTFVARREGYLSKTFVLDPAAADENNVVSVVLQREPRKVEPKRPKPTPVKRRPPVEKSPTPREAPKAVARPPTPPPEPPPAPDPEPETPIELMP